MFLKIELLHDFGLRLVHVWRFPVWYIIKIYERESYCVLFHVSCYHRTWFENGLLQNHLVVLSIQFRGVLNGGPIKQPSPISCKLRR